MFCKYCGKSIDEDSIFCKFCGKPQNEVKPEENPEVKKDTPELETKIFTFGGMAYNEKNIRQINEWLASQRIIIKSVSANAFMNTNVPMKWETVINRLEIRYVTKPEGKLYQMSYFKSWKWIGSSYEKVNAAFEKWKKENPKRTVIWDRCMGHQADGGSTQSLFFIYC